jgi:hypothetical protein
MPLWLIEGEERAIQSRDLAEIVGHVAILVPDYAIGRRFAPDPLAPSGLRPLVSEFPKYRLPPTQISCIRPPSRPKQGRLAIVTDAGRDAVDADSAKDERRFRGRRSRVVLTPRRRRQVCGGNVASDGDKKARSPGRARRKPLKPLRAGMPGCSGGPVVTNARVYYTTRAAAGASAPGIPHALMGRKVHQRLGRIASRECGLISCLAVIAIIGRRFAPTRWLAMTVIKTEASLPPFFIPQSIRTLPQPSRRMRQQRVDQPRL